MKKKLIEWAIFNYPFIIICMLVAGLIPAIYAKNIVMIVILSICIVLNLSSWRELHERHESYEIMESDKKFRSGERKYALLKLTRRFMKENNYSTWTKYMLVFRDEKMDEQVLYVTYVNCKPTIIIDDNNLVTKEVLDFAKSTIYEEFGKTALFIFPLYKSDETENFIREHMKSINHRKFDVYTMK